LKLRQIIALTFLPPTKKPGAFDELKFIIPEETSEIIQWFENNYVHSRIRRKMRGGNGSRIAPLFPPKYWSVFERMKLGIPRTQNRVEVKMRKKYWCNYK